MGTTLLGFPEKSVKFWTFNKWNRMYEFYKKYHNFKIRNQLFEIELSEDEKNESLEWFDD